MKKNQEKRRNMKNKAVIFGGAIAISVFLLFSMSIAGVINSDQFLGSNLKVETETDHISIDTNEGYTKLDPEVDNVFSNIEDKSSIDLEDSDNNVDDGSGGPCVFCADCFTNTIEGTAKLCDGSNAPGINVQVQSSSGTKTCITLSTGYWQVNVGSSAGGGNWTWGSSFTVTYSGSCSGISWMGSDSGTVSQPPTCLYDCGTTFLTPSNSLTATAGGSPTTIDEGDTVSFTGSASGGYPPYSWHWDFDGDGTSNLQNPSHQFDTAGVYDCTLTVTDSCDTDDDIVTITVNAPNDDPNTPSTPSGPTARDVGKSGTYSTSATDPDGDQVQYRFDWDGGNTSDWTSLGASGHTDSLSHSWSSPGTYYVKAQARDEYGATSDWSSGLKVTVKSSTNDPPNTPSMPDGPTTGDVDAPYTYSTSATDPNGDQVKYGWDWNGDDTVDDWTNLHISGTVVSTSHTWGTPGTYNVKVRAKDEHGAMGDWSEPITVTIEGEENHPPGKPDIDGNTSGKTGVEYSYNITSTDPDGDMIKYIVDWGDDTNITTILYNSGETVTVKHTWSEKGTYTIRSKAVDEHDAESDWATLEISMPKTKAINPFLPFLERLMERFPILEQLLTSKFFSQQNIVLRAETWMSSHKVNLGGLPLSLNLGEV